MLPALILALTALGLALARLWAYRRQLEDMAREIGRASCRERV